MVEEKLTEASARLIVAGQHTQFNGGHDRDLRQTVLALIADMSWVNTTARER